MRRTKQKINDQSKGFTLLELLIAISISGFVALAMIQVFQNVQKIIQKSRRALIVNKNICLMFNQIERDFNTALIPTIAKVEKKDAKKDKEDKKNKEDKKDKEESEKKDKTIFFLSEIDEEADELKIEDKKFKPLKRVSFVNTNPLQIWGQKRTRFVRVSYELTINKEKSKSGPTVYDLYRKETPDLENIDFKEPGEEVFKTDSQKKQEDFHEIRRHLIASNVKGLYIEYTMPRPEPKTEKAKDKEWATKSAFASETGEEELWQSAEWGKEDETKNVVPQQVELHVILFAEHKTKTVEKQFSCVIPIFSYPTQKEKKEKEDKNQKPGQPQAQQKPAAKQTGQQKQQTPTQPNS